LSSGDTYNIKLSKTATVHLALKTPGMAKTPVYFMTFLVTHFSSKLNPS